MAFWSQGNFADARRTRAGIPSSTSSAARTAAANMFRDRESPESNEMFFETTPNVTFPARSRWADRMTSSVFDDFPSRRMGSNFTADPPSFGSLHRHRQPPSWMSEAKGSKESSPAGSDSSLPRHAAFHRADSIPVRVAHESRPGSRSSTPESTGSGSASSRPSSVSADQTHHNDTDMLDGVEEHPMPTSKAAKQGFTARHQPKVHHIPIHVEPRDGSQAFTTLTPPVVEAAQAVPFHVIHEKSQSMSPPVPVQEGRRPSFPTEQPQPQEVRPKRTIKVTKNPMSSSNTRRGNRDLPVPKEADTETDALTDPQPVKPKRKTPFETLEEVQVDVDKLKQNVADFDGAKGDKHYLYLDEMLTRNLIRLDNIETEGNEELRNARRGVIVSINECIQNLDQNAISNDAAAAAAAAAHGLASNKPEEMETEAQEVSGNDLLAPEVESGIAESENESSTADGVVTEDVLTENSVELLATPQEPLLEDDKQICNTQLENTETLAAGEPAPVLEENDRLESQPVVEESMESSETVMSDKVKGTAFVASVLGDGNPEKNAPEVNKEQESPVIHEASPVSEDIIVVG